MYLQHMYIVLLHIFNHDWNLLIFKLLNLPYLFRNKKMHCSMFWHFLNSCTAPSVCRLLVIQFSKAAGLLLFTPKLKVYLVIINRVMVYQMFVIIITYGLSNVCDHYYILLTDFTWCFPSNVYVAKLMTYSRCALLPVLQDTVLQQ